MTIESLVVMGETTLRLYVVSDVHATGTSELTSLVSSLESYYRSLTSNDKTHLSPQPKSVDKGALLYYVYQGAGSKDYIGTVKVTPEGVDTKVDINHDIDYAIPDQTVYMEKYLINFFPQDKLKRKEHRDGFARYIDPDGTKQKRIKSNKQ